MKTHPALERPSDIGDNPQPLELANHILWKFLQMPAGGLYAKWDSQSAKAVWFYSRERDYMFREPRCDTVIYEEHDRSRFRSLIFRLASLADEGLCGDFEFQRPGLTSRRFEVHASFFPEAAIGLWIAITSKDEQDGAANGSQPIRAQTNPTPTAAGSRR